MSRLIPRVSPGVAVLGIAILSAGFAGQSAMAQARAQHGQTVAEPSATAAMVDGHTISRKEVENVAVHRYGQEVLDRLIDNYLIDREADRLHVTVSEAAIDKQVQALVDAIKPKTLEQGLEAHHQTLAELREDIRQRLLGSKLAALSSAPGHFVHAHAIFIGMDSDSAPKSSAGGALAQITAIQKQLAAGAHFDDLAKQYSQDPVLRKRGGDIGILFEGCPGDPAVIEAALKLQPGMTADSPVKTAFGYYVIMVSSTDDKHPADEDKLYSDAETQDEMNRGGRMLPEYLRGLRARAKITQLLNP
jgi:foldase protein PrsA